MIIDFRGRCTGKTSELIIESFKTGIPIITPSLHSKDYVLLKAKEMGLNDIEVFALIEIQDNRGSVRFDKVLIDDLDELLSVLFNAKVVKATMSGR